MYDKILMTWRDFRIAASALILFMCFLATESMSMMATIEEPTIAQSGFYGSVILAVIPLVGWFMKSSASPMKSAAPNKPTEVMNVNS